jgi:hypothetical protein
VAFHTDEPKHVEAVARGPTAGLVPVAFRSADYASYSSWHQQLVKSVRRNRVVEVRLLIETGEGGEKR